MHAIEEGDPASIDFCRFLINTDIKNPDFLTTNSETKSKFDRDVIVSQTTTNPTIGPLRVKTGKKGFVWMGIIHKNLIRPYFLPQNFNGATYENFLGKQVVLPWPR